MFLWARKHYDTVVNYWTVSTDLMPASCVPPILTTSIDRNSYHHHTDEKAEAPVPSRMLFHHSPERGFPTAKQWGYNLYWGCQRHCPSAETEFRVTC